MLFPIDLIVAILYWSVTRPFFARPLAAVWAPTLATMLWAWAVCWVASRLALSWLRSQGLSGGAARGRVAAVVNGCRAFLVLVFIFQLREIGWPGSLYGSGSHLLDTLAGLAPYLVMLAGAWVFFRPLDDLVAAGASRPGAGTAGRPGWRLGRYLLFRWRYTFFVLVPWFVLLLLYDLGERFVPAPWLARLQASPPLLLGGVALLMAGAAILFPAVIVRLWGCRPLPEGALRSALTELQERAGRRFGQVYVWSLGGGTLLNGAVLGFVPPVRYLLLSQGLVHHLSVEEIRGVVAHELGHVRHRHLLWYLLLTAAFILGATGLLGLVIPDPHLLALAVGGAVAIYFRFLFGALSRHFERQADLYGLELLGTSDPLVRSLEKIAFLSGNIRQAKCWHHASIAERVEWLRAVEEDPALGRSHHKLCRRLQRTSGLAAGAVLLATLGLMGQELAALAPAPPSRYEAFEHWQRILRLVPEDAEAPRRLAELARAGRAPPPLRTPEAVERFERLARERAAGR